ncbi:MAG: transporter substrate-binding domain-containing protein [Thermodesulfobacteriota bacterium]|nr:transporter substrate-binding domain-containing protein [Thermodesulfobacteriota bacterium]
MTNWQRVIHIIGFNLTHNTGKCLWRTVVACILVTTVLAAGMPAFAESTKSPCGGNPVRSAAEINYPPFCMQDADGRATGFSVELLRAALRAMDCHVMFRTGQWTNVKKWLARGDVQVLPLVGRTPERDPVFDFTFPYMSLHGAIVVRKTTTGIHDLDDLTGRQVAVMKGDNAEEFLRRKDRDITIKATTTFEATLRQLSEGRHDAVVIQRIVALRLLRETGIKNLKIINKPLNEFRQDFCFAVREGDSDMLALLNEGLSLIMADGTFRHLRAKWFATLDLPTHSRIVIGGDRNYPPYEFLDENGRPTGYNVDLTRAIAEKTGMDIDIRLDDWAEIRKGLANGDIDAIHGMFYSVERDLEFNFSPPHTVIDHIAVVAKDTAPPPETISQLRGLDIVVMQGDIMHDFARDNDLVPVTAVASQEEALRQVAEGEHDCALVARIPALYWIKKHGWKNLAAGHHPFLSAEYCYAVPKNRKALLARLSEGLKTLEETGEYREIHKKWLGVYKKTPPGIKKILRYTAMILIPILLLLVFVLFRSRSLGQQAARKTEELQHSHEFQRAMIACSPVALYSVDFEGRVLSWNASAERIFGWKTEEVIGRPIPIVTDDKTKEYAELRSRMMNGEEGLHTEVDRQKKDGTRFTGSLSTAPIRNSRGEVIAIMGAMEDITERIEREKTHRQLQEQLTQAQRMESVGRLAGGVAHDYNNMLSLIIGYAEMALEKVTADDPLHEDLEEILTAAERSTDITRQLLAFARKQTIAPRVLDMNETVESMLKMLRRLIGEDIDLAWLPGTDTWPVKIDPAQVDQILANLCVNARDAISGVGKITIETSNVHFNEEYCADHAGFVPGDFVSLAVSDNGEGMNAQAVDKIFEPFFTTKGVGQGTGLGLATVYGIVKQNDGFINVYSEPGKGTTFRIYLPKQAAATQAVQSESTESIARSRGETVLLVEDETPILALGQKMLESLDYTVIVAQTPTAAIDRARECDTIDLLITDVIMPEMNGRELAGHLQPLHPHLRVLFMSGYTASVIAHHGVLDDDVHFLQKPFSKRDLALKVRDALDAPTA